VDFQKLFQAKALLLIHKPGVKAGPDKEVGRLRKRSKLRLGQSGKMMIRVVGRYMIVDEAIVKAEATNLE
jgi:hypothetical protein